MYSSKYLSLLHVTDSTIKFFIHASNFFFTSQLVLSYSSNTVPYHIYMASQAALVVKNLPANAQDEGSIPGSGRSPRVRNANPLQYFCLGNHMDWRATVHEVAKSQTWLSDWAYPIYMWCAMHSIMCCISGTVGSVGSLSLYGLCHLTRPLGSNFQVHFLWDQ